MKNKFYLFEGIDGSGKSTLAKKFAKLIKGIYYYTPPKAILPLRHYADSSSPKIRYQFYQLGNYIANDEISKILKSKDVVVDRYVYGTAAYHSALLNKGLQIPNDLLLPDKIIYITASFEKIKQRLKERKSVNKYEKLEFLKKVIKRYDSILADSNNVLKIDTTNMTIDETLGYLKNKLNI